MRFATASPRDSSWRAQGSPRAKSRHTTASNASCAARPRVEILVASPLSHAAWRAVDGLHGAGSRPARSSVVASIRQAHSPARRSARISAFVLAYDHKSAAYSSHARSRGECAAAVSADDSVSGRLYASCNQVQCAPAATSRAAHGTHPCRGGEPTLRREGLCRPPLRLIEVLRVQRPQFSTQLSDSRSVRPAARAPPPAGAFKIAPHKVRFDTETKPTAEPAHRRTQKNRSPPSAYDRQSRAAGSVQRRRKL